MRRGLLVLSLALVALVTMGAGWLSGPHFGVGLAPGFAPVQRVAAGTDTGIAEDDTGTTWVCATTTTAMGNRWGHAVLSYDDKLWSIGGNIKGSDYYSDDVYSSTDGITWTIATTTAAFGNIGLHSALVFDGKMWTIGGDTSKVYSSTDGITWTIATSTAAFGSRRLMASCVFNGKMWITSGLDNVGGTTPNDVWYSSDGITWTAATTNAFSYGTKGWSAVMYAYDGKMFVGGGRYLSDKVYSSTDGITWTVVTENAAAFAGGSERRSMGHCVYNNKMWAICGYGPASVYDSQVFYSTDGINWPVATSALGCSGRQAYSCVTVHKGHMWLVGGLPPNNIFWQYDTGEPDVWRSN